MPEEDPQAARSAYYCSINWGKQTLMLDLQAPENQAIAHQLVQEAHIVISNFKPRAAQRMRMDYAFLKTLNPSIIFGQITGFGEDDDTSAFDVVLQAEAGFLYMTGEPGRDPVKMPVALIDILAAHQLKAGLLIALLHLYKTGNGSYITVSLFEAAIASLANQATNWLMAGHIPQRIGTQHPNIAPYGDMLDTKDHKPIVLAVGTERQFENLCNALNISLKEDFFSNAYRVHHRVALLQLLQPIFLQYDKDDILARLRKAGVPAAAIRTMPEVFEHPTAQKMILEATLPDGQVSKCVKTVAFTMK